MPKFRVSAVSAAIAAAILMFVATETRAETQAKTLLFAEFGANRGARAAALEWFADELQRRSGGSLKLRFQWGKALLGANAVLHGIADGVADMGSIIGHFAPRQLRGYNVGDLPVDNSDVWVGMRAMYRLSTTHPALVNEFERAGVVYVTNYSTGPIQLICTRGIKRLSDLKDINLRGSGSYGKTFADFGARVQRMPQPDVYQALDSGLLDCNQNYYYSIKAYKQYEVAGYVLELDWGQNMSFGIVMNRASFARLSAAEQKILRETGSDFIDYFAQLMIASNDRDKAEMVAGAGGSPIEVTVLDRDERAALLATGKKYIETWVSEAAADGKDGTGILAAYQRHIDVFTRTRDREGYPWTR